MIKDFDRFDAVVLLTEGQRRDVIDRIGPRGHAYVIPNSTDMPEVRSPGDRDVLAGAVLARLDGNKRVGHAIKAVKLAAQRTGLPVRLDVYGDGPDRERLARQAARVPGVTLHGHEPDAVDRLEEASFLLLTSRNEGQALTLAEAMARGCVPIAYDVRYGPADLITDKVDGVLVPDVGPDALAGAVEWLVTREQEVLDRMRQAARATARGFSDERVLARWAELFHDLSSPDRGRRHVRAERLSSVRMVVGMLPGAVRAKRRSG
jgi:poly(glycerol-phosphate) alpha-glucosyltransferase